MTVTDLNSSLTQGLKGEIEAIEQTSDALITKLNQATSSNDYYKTFSETVYGREFCARVSHLANNKKLKILDIGFGRGESSLYLQEQGHTVYALEPSPLNCSILKQASEKFALPLSIFQGKAEDIDRIPEKDFDLCIFNSSLHHCDEPLKALRHCFSSLRPNGFVLAVNEPLLKFYRSKRWYFNKLESAPIEVGHYGGNEHIYSYREYLRLFKEAGFEHVKGLHHSRHRFPRETLAYDLHKKIHDQYVLSDTKLFCKYGILLALKSLLKKESGPIQALFKYLSLTPITFTAQKITR